MRWWVLALALAVIAVGGPLTGFAVRNGTVDVTIAPLSSGYFTIFAHEPASSEVYQRINVTTEFVNSGSETYDAQLLLDVRFGNLTAYANTSDITVSLDPGERRAFKAGFTPVVSGSYWLHVRSSWGGGRVSEAWKAIFVANQSPVYVQLPGTVTPPGGGGSQKVISPIAPGMRLEHPRAAHLSPGRSTTITIEVVNTGQVDLTDLQFHLTGSGLLADVSPGGILRVPVGERRSFLLQLTAPQAALGSYEYRFTVVSGQASAYGELVVTVSEAAAPVVANEELENCRLQYRDLERQVSELRQLGQLVPDAEAALRELDRIISAAETLIANGEVEEALKRLERCTSSLRTAAVALGVARAPQPLAFPATVPLSTFLVLTIVFGVLFALLLALLLRRHEKKRREVISARVGAGGR